MDGSCRMGELCLAALADQLPLLQHPHFPPAPCPAAWPVLAMMLLTDWWGIPLATAAQNQASRKINLIVCQGQRQEKEWIKEKRKIKASPFSLVAENRAAVNRSTSLLFICGWIEIILV